MRITRYESSSYATNKLSFARFSSQHTQSLFVIKHTGEVWESVPGGLGASCGGLMVIVVRIKKASEEAKGLVAGALVLGVSLNLYDLPVISP